MTTTESREVGRQRVPSALFRRSCTQSDERTLPVPAPGARVEIRDQEWVVRKCQRTSRGGLALHVTGVSDVVRGRDSVFLADLVDVRVSAPEETKLVADDSEGYRHSRLYLEGLLRRTPSAGARFSIGLQGVTRLAANQLGPVAGALAAPRARVLLADGDGIGRTTEVGVLLSELIKRGRGERLLVVAPESNLAQLQRELWAHFTIPLVRLDPVGPLSDQRVIPSSQNPFYFYDRCVVSVDTLERDTLYRRYLEDAHWDVIVIDECRNIAVRGGSDGDGWRSSRLGELLADRSDHLILTSSTPHDEWHRSPAGLLNLLEPTAVPDSDNLEREQVQYLLAAFEAGEAGGEDFAPEVRLSLFPDAITYARAAFEQLEEADRERAGEASPTAGKVAWQEPSQAFVLWPSDDLERRYDYLPPELIDIRNQGDSQIKLTTDPVRAKEAFAAARQHGDGWPEWEYFWDLHPVAEWLDDRVLAHLSRNEAPVLRIASGLAADERLFVLQGTIANQRSQHVLVDWMTVCLKGHAEQRSRADDGSARLGVTGTLSIETFRETAERLGLASSLENPRTPLEALEKETLEGLLPEVVGAARAHMDSLRRRRASAMRGAITEALRRNGAWKAARLAALEERRLDQGGDMTRAFERRIAEEQEEVIRRYGEHERFLEESIETEPEPYLRVCCVLIAG